MKKKRDAKKGKQKEKILSPAEQGELQMILDRLSVQNPDGESFQNYVESLAGTLAGREDFILVLLEQLSKRPTGVGFKVFQKLKDLPGEGCDKRALKQACYRFRQKGFSVRENAPPQEKVVLVRKEERKPLAHLIALDDTFGFVAAILPGEGYAHPMALTVFAENNFETIYARVTESSYSVYREYLEMIADDAPGTKICEVPAAHAARLVHELQEFSGRRDSVPDLEKAKRLLRLHHDEQRPPHAHELLDKIEDPGAAIRRVRVDQLLGKLNPLWLAFEKDELAPYHEELERLRNPVLVLPPETQQERIQSVLKQAAQELCAGMKRKFYIRFLEEKALVHQLAGEKEMAHEAWIVAQHLASEESPDDNPLVVAMVGWSLAEHWPESPEDEENEGDLYAPSDSGLFVPR